MNSRIFFEKKADFQTEAQVLLTDLSKNLHLKHLDKVRIFDGFDLFNIPDAYVDELTWQVLGDPTSDELYQQLPPLNDSGFSLSLEFLPGQFDQRADAAEQAARLLSSELEQTQVISFKSYLFSGNFSPMEQAKITEYLLNPVESRVKNLSQLSIESATPASPVEVINGFIDYNEDELIAFKQTLGLSLNDNDCLFIQAHFKSIKRNPSETEIRVLDTYWSDHCRHTTFFTAIENIEFNAGNLSKRLQQSFDEYLAYRQQSGISEHPITLMDLATINARTLRKQGKLDEVEVSDEINACSVFIDVNVGAEKEKWLLQFKNETHNHPTEIEPFGGASTCLGGAIRDPLSGRSYIYQAIRVTGSADPLEPIETTLAGKLPQYQITRGAAQGYSSYGNQIGVATTQVAEIYHQGYKAKRMEVGAVVAAVPASNVVRKKPVLGDKIILLGGKTGRDGCGGASGSSKAHTAESLQQSGAEVQKGNPPVERAIQRLFRNPKVTTKIKKCNDFGAGGVCVAVGELADSLHIDLDKIPVKYQGLSGTELTISESQERMAVVVDPTDVDFFIAECEKENTLATVIAEVTNDSHMTISYQGQQIVHLCRDFIETAGAEQNQENVILAHTQGESPFTSVANDEQTNLLSRLAELNNASQRGLQDMFDSNVGASTVLLPYGGQSQSSPAEGSVQLLPKAGTSTASAITYGFNAEISSYSPYHGGAYAVVESVCRQIALGASLDRIHFSFQEYFEKIGQQPEKWGKPFSALLGAFSASAAFDLAAIGGKDSMSGSFGELHVPPTLISFAVSHLEADEVISNELKSAGNYLYLLRHQALSDDTPNYAQLKSNFKWLSDNKSKLCSIISCKHSGGAVELAKAALGNQIGFSIDTDGTEVSDNDLFTFDYGSFILESEVQLDNLDNLIAIGETNDSHEININTQNYALDEIYSAFTQTLDPVFPLFPQVKGTEIKTYHFASKGEQTRKSVSIGGKKPKIFIPVFSGTNSEYDLTHAFNRHGGNAFMQPFVNLSQAHIQASINEFCLAIQKSQVLALAGGFSAGDEPNGSGKFIAMVLKNTQVQDEIHALLARDGLILGICNGFQALVKSGLLPYGKVTPRQQHDITLAHNNSNRHIARIASTQICHNNSPWLADFNVGEIHQVAFSHGEGRFTATPEQLQILIDNGQIATQYVDDTGHASMLAKFNPNGSVAAIEGLTSECGKILGKMGHSERYAKYCYQNYPDFRAQNIFAAGVKYFE